jgi:hypothetical protein
MMKLEPSTETKFSCGHIEVSGGCSAADPTAIYSEMAGLKTFVKSEALCTVCTNPQKFPEIIARR